VADRGAQRHRPVLHRGAEDSAGHGAQRPAEELAEVDQVAADVGERAGAGAAPVPPADRRVRVEAVIAPVVPVEVADRPQHAGADLLAHRVDGRRPAEGQPDRGDPVGALRRCDHRLAVRGRAGQRLLAEHVLARG
jgi:hypothetical protein